MDYTLVSADSHLSLPPGFFRSYSGTKEILGLQFHVQPHFLIHACFEPVAVEHSFEPQEQTCKHAIPRPAGS